jgi:hypothetical protein
VGEGRVFGGSVPVFFAGGYKNYFSRGYCVLLVFGGYDSFAFGDYENLFVAVDILILLYIP